MIAEARRKSLAMIQQYELVKSYFSHDLVKNMASLGFYVPQKKVETLSPLIKRRLKIKRGTAFFPETTNFAIFYNKLYNSFEPFYLLFLTNDEEPHKKNYILTLNKENKM